MLTKCANLCEAIVKLFKTKVLEFCYELVFFEKNKRVFKGIKTFYEALTVCRIHS